MTPFVAIYLICSLLVLLLCIQPFVWQVTHRNIAASSHIAFIMMILLTNVVNASIWPNAISMTDWPGFVLCDIELPLIAFAQYGVYGSTAAILRNLAEILDTSNMALPSRKQKIVDLSISCTLCFGVPLLPTGLQYLTFQSRYSLFPVAGCEADQGSTWIDILVWMVPIWALDIVIGFYAVLTLLRIHRYHKTVSAILLSSPHASSTSTTTRTRYYRLLALSLLTAIIIVPSSIVNSVFYFNVSAFNTPLAPTSTMSIVTVFWGDQPTRPVFFMLRTANTYYVNPTWARFLYAGYGLLITLILGCGKDAWRMYRLWIGHVVSFLRTRQSSDASSELARSRNHQHSDRLSGSTVFSNWRSSVTSAARNVWATAMASKASLTTMKMRGASRGSLEGCVGSSSSSSGDVPISPRNLLMQHAQAHAHVKTGEVEVEVEVAEMRSRSTDMMTTTTTTYKHAGDVV